MPAKKMGRGATAIKVKHLTNALFWVGKAVDQTRRVLLDLDPDTTVSTSEATVEILGGNNIPRVFNCPPGKKKKKKKKP